MDDLEGLVLRFYEAWSRLDVDELMEYFSDDAVWDNVPIGIVRGSPAIRSWFQYIVSEWTREAKVHLEVLHIASKGNRVFTERVDHVESLGRRVDLPVAGIFQIEDGKITFFRDYWDEQSYRRGMPRRVELPASVRDSIQPG